MTDLSLLVDIRDDIVSFTQSIKKFTDELSNTDGRHSYLSIVEKLMVEGTRCPYEIQSLAIEALTLTLIPYFFLTRETASFGDMYRLWENNPIFGNDMKKLMPKTSKLITTLYRISHRDRLVFKWWRTYQQSPSVLSHTPREVERDFQSKKVFLRRPSDTTLCVEYYRNFQRGTYCADNQQPMADSVLYLDMDLHQGANLEFVRKYFGLEALAIITNRSEYRRVFTPGNENHLSPVAIYDLTHQLRQPLRIFEPRTSSLTKIKRKVHEFFCDTTYFVYSLFKLLTGFPNENISYLRLSYGSTYASCYECVGKITRQPRINAQKGFAFLMGLLFMAFMLFVQYILCPVGSLVVHTTRHFFRGVHHFGSFLMKVPRSLYGVSKNCLCNTPSFALGVVQFIARSSCDVINDVIDGQVGNKSLYVVVPLVIWFLMAEYFSTKA